MNLNDLRAGYEDIRILIHMAEELEKEGISDESEREAAKQRLDYIKSKILKITMDNNKKIEFISQNMID